MSNKLNALYKLSAKLILHALSCHYLQGMINHVAPRSSFGVMPAVFIILTDYILLPQNAAHTSKCIWTPAMHHIALHTSQTYLGSL